MADRFPGGVISKTPPAVSGPAPGTGGAASGVWTLGEVLGYVQAGIWPGEALPFNYALYTWGYNSSGQIGDGTTVTKSSPVQVGALTNWAQVAMADHTVCVTTAGTLFTWGNGGNGRLGHGDTVFRSSPVQVGALTNWAQASATLQDTACVKTNGTLFTWGDNGSGQGGHGDRSARLSPLQVGALTNWAQVSSGRQHTACVKTDGTLFTWGAGAYGRLGHGDTVSRSSPVQVGALTNWAQVSAGYFNTVCVTTAGTLFAWGSNVNGSLGLGDSFPAARSSPVQVGALTNWAQVSTVNRHTACVKTDGTLFTWGSGGEGRLGHGDTVSRSSPVQVGALTNWAQVAVGYNGFTACVTTAGTLFTWGSGSFGRLGHDDTVYHSSPVQVGARTNWAQVAVGEQSTACTQEA
jgi:alpha-tubulin suppressor-like RCC1 family protein